MRIELRRMKMADFIHYDEDVEDYIKTCIGMVRLNIALHKKNVRETGKNSWLSEVDKYIELAEKALKYNKPQGIPFNSIMWNNVKDGKMSWVFEIMEKEKMEEEDA